MELPDNWRELAAALVGTPELTRIELAQRTGLDLDHARRLWRALGFPPVPDDAPIFTKEDALILIAIRELMEAHGVTFEILVQLTRVTGQALARIADAQVGTAGVGIAGGGAEALRHLAPELERVIGYVWRRHLLAALLRHAANPGAEEREVTVGFADLVGFTVLSQALDAHELAAMVDRFESIVYEHIPERGGRIIKLIGDEVMFAGDDATAVAEIALALVEAHHRDRELPDVRVGLASGPTVAWEGDIYGPTVNLASRLVNLARPGTVLVSDALGETLAATTPAFALHHLRPIHLQGIGRVRSWVLRRQA